MSSAGNGRYDAIVVGAGHNGLAAAATLARKGKRVLVLERAGQVGGMAKTAELKPGVKGPRLAHLLWGMSARVSSELGLDVQGLNMAARDLPTVSLSPDGRHVVIEGAKVRFADGSAHPDADRYADLWQRLLRFSALLAPVWDRTPPRLAGGGLSRDRLFEGAHMAKLGLDLRRLGKADMREFLRIVLSNAADLVLDQIPDGPLAGALAAEAVLGARAGPRSPGTVLTLLYRLAQGGAKHLPAGGMGAVAEALAAAARGFGAEIRTGAAVNAVLVEDDRVRGVDFAEGERAFAPLVLSSLDALSTLRLAGPEHFDVEACRRARQIRAEGVAAKVNLVLNGLPDFPGLDPSFRRARLLVAPSVIHVERAFNPAKYGELTEAPMIEAIIPSLSDSSLTQGEDHMLSAVVQFVPYTLKGGWNENARRSLADAVTCTLGRFAPGLEERVTATDVLTPQDIEAETGARGGHWHHGELAMDQMLMLRPMHTMARYSSGVPGLYLCGAGAHPGGDVTGMAGRNAALQSLNDGARP